MKPTIIWTAKLLSTLVLAATLTRVFISTGAVGKFISTETGRTIHGDLLLYTGVGGGESGMDLIVVLLLFLALIPSAIIVWIVSKVRLR
jgi:hypothetical protein